MSYNDVITRNIVDKENSLIVPKKKFEFM